MKRSQPLIGNCLVVTVPQSKPVAQPVIGDVFEPFENGGLRHFPACYQPVAVIAISNTEDVVRGQHAPEHDVFQRV